jgi:hypothetical protein
MAKAKKASYKMSDKMKKTTEDFDKQTYQNAIDMGLPHNKEEAASFGVNNEFICPLVKVVGEKHLLEQLIARGEAPEIKAVGYMRLGNQRNSWVSYTITTKGREVLKIEIDEPNMREIAEESAKIAFVENLMEEASKI